MMERDAAHVYMKRELTDADVQAMKALQETCNRHEGLDGLLNLEVAGSGEANAGNRFLYSDRSGLLGALTLQGEGDGIEVYVAVHPDHRRRGIGSGLVDAATGECRRRGIRHWVLVCEDASKSGQAFVRAHRAQYQSAEHRMRFDPGNAPPAAPPHPTLELVRADGGDLEALTRLMAVSLGRSEDKVRKRVAGDLTTSHRRFYLARVDGDLVGSLGVVDGDPNTDIVAFGVLPQHRGQGIGRRMLQQILSMLVAEGRRSILIEVATENRNALSLYRSCGFTVTNTYGFYRMELGR